MRVLRFRVRTLLVVVAIVAALMGGDAMRRRRARYLWRSEFHTQHAEQIGKFLRTRTWQDQGDLPYFQRWIEWDAAMARKYRRAASRPWWIVEPDAPQPDGGAIFTEDWERRINP